jgi:hypothetical protein
MSIFGFTGEILPGWILSFPDQKAVAKLWYNFHRQYQRPAVENKPFILFDCSCGCHSSDGRNALAAAFSRD